MIIVVMRFLYERYVYGCFFRELVEIIGCYFGMLQVNLNASQGYIASSV
jgi:hypothetical protein